MTKELTEPHAIISDASRKLTTVIAILSEMELQGVHSVKTELVKALLKPAEEALRDD